MHSQKLAPIDANGVVLRPGMRVRILTIPDWLTHDLPQPDAARLLEVKGTVMTIAKFDKFGYVWFDDWFCLKPDEIAVES